MLDALLPWRPLWVTPHAYRRAAARVDRETIDRWTRDGGIRDGILAEVRAGLLLDRASWQAPRWADSPTRWRTLYVLNDQESRAWAVRDEPEGLYVLTVLLRPQEPLRPPPPPPDAYRLLLRPGEHRSAPSRNRAVRRLG